MIPGLKPYLSRLPKSVVDGGYYTKTRENRPLIGRLPVEGAYVMGALSGFGVMAGCGAGDLLAAHLTGSKLPHYAPAFSLERYEDPKYQKLLETWAESGNSSPPRIPAVGDSPLLLSPFSVGRCMASDS
jgi:hypothetical protein